MDKRIAIDLQGMCCPLQRGTPAHGVHGCGRGMWQIHRTGRLAAREVQCEAVVPVDTPACATRSARALGPRAPVGPPERGGTAGGRSHPRR